MKKKNVNFFELIPVRMREWEDIGDGRVAILQPRFFNEFAKRFFDSVLKRGTVRVRLDKEGSFVWLICDGKKSMDMIANEFNKQFSCEDGADRLVKFMQYLEKCEMISYKNL